MMDASSSDDTLVGIAKKRGKLGDRAYSFLVVRHQPWVTRLLVALLPHGEADEVKQETFLSGWLNLKQLLINAAFPGWIRGIAVRGAYKRYRRRNVEDRYQVLASVPTEISDPAQSLQNADGVRFVLSQMDYIYREILVLRYVEELNIEEICTTLDLGTSAVKMRLKRARDQFKVIYVEATNG